MRGGFVKRWTYFVGSPFPDAEGVLDDVGGAFEWIDLLHGGLDFAGGGAVLVLFEDCLDGGAETGGVELAAGDYDPGSSGCDSGGYSGLVVAVRESDEGDAFGEGLEDGVEAGVGDDGGGAFDEFELRGVGNDDGVAGELAEACWVEAASEGEDELGVEARAGFGDGFEDGFGAVLEGS